MAYFPYHDMSPAEMTYQLDYKWFRSKQNILSTYIHVLLFLGTFYCFLLNVLLLLSRRYDFSFEEDAIKVGLKAYKLKVC